MKLLITFVLATFATTAVAQLPFQRQQQPQAQSARDAVAVAPNVHHVLFDNQHVRVYRVLASHGQTTEMHTHPPFALVSLRDARVSQTMADGTSSVFDFQRGQVVWLDGLEHRWELLAGELHLIGVEVKAATRGVPQNLPELPQTTATTVDPTHHHVVLDNPHVRIFEALAERGATAPMHTHPPFVLISLDKVRLRMQMPDGTNPIFDLNPGQVLWGEGMEHGWEVLSGTAHVVAVEIKAARATTR